MFADTLNVTSDGKAMIAAPNVFAALRGEQTHLCAVTNCSSCVVMICVAGYKVTPFLSLWLSCRAGDI